MENKIEYTSYLIIAPESICVPDSSFDHIAWILENHFETNCLEQGALIQLVCDVNNVNLVSFLEELVEDKCFALKQVEDVNKYIKDNDEKLKKNVYKPNLVTGILSLVNSPKEIPATFKQLERRYGKLITTVVID